MSTERSKDHDGMKCEPDADGPTSSLLGTAMEGRPPTFWAGRLRSTDPAERLKAVQVLARTSCTASECGPALVEALVDTDAAVREAARDLFLSLCLKNVALEAELAKVKTVMESQMTSVLENERKLTALSKDLEEARRDQHEFFSRFLHDELGQILTGIVMDSNFLIRKIPPELASPVQDVLLQINKAASDSVEMVRRLIRLGRLGDCLQAEQLDMDLIVTNVREKLGAEMSGRPIEWKIDCLPCAFGDPFLIRIVWENLIRNAMNREGDPAHIQVGSNRFAGELIYFVRDNGYGLSEASRPFALYRSLSSEKYGLAGVKQIVQSHGGRVWYESEVGHGSTFYFSLPAKTVVS